MKFDHWWNQPQVQENFDGQREAAQAAWNASALVIAELLAEVSADISAELKSQRTFVRQIGRLRFKASANWDIRGVSWLVHSGSGWKIIVEKTSSPVVVRAVRDFRTALFTTSSRTDEWLKERWPSSDIERCKNPIQSAINFVEGSIK